MVNAFNNYSLQLMWEGGWLSHEERPRDLVCMVGGELAQGGCGRALPQPATPAWDGQSPKLVLTVGTEEGSARQGSVSRVTALLPPSLGALFPMPPHRNLHPCSWQRSCGAVGSLTQPHWATVAVEDCHCWWGSHSSRSPSQNNVAPILCQGNMPSKVPFSLQLPPVLLSKHPFSGYHPKQLPSLFPLCPPSVVQQFPRHSQDISLP